MKDNLLNEMFAALPKNLNDFGEEHKNKFQEILKLENHEINISTITFSYDTKHFKYYT